MNLSNSTYSNSTMRTNVYLSNHLLESLDFLVSGVMISLVSSVGLIGNTLLLILLSKQMYLLSSLLIFSMPVFLPDCSLLQRQIPYYMLPLAHIGMIGSVFSTVALSTERYIAIVHPFVKYRNISRQNFWYVQVYGLWLNTILNIIAPLLGMLVINIIVYMKLQDHVNVLHNIQRENLGESNDSKRFNQEKFIRKKEVTISMINIYIVVTMVCCHSVRIIPNIHEIYTFVIGDDNSYWPNWIQLVTKVSHLMLSISCSFKYYVYLYCFRYKK